MGEVKKVGVPSKNAGCTAITCNRDSIRFRCATLREPIIPAHRTALTEALGIQYSNFPTAGPALFVCTFQSDRTTSAARSSFCRARDVGRFSIVAAVAGRCAWNLAQTAVSKIGARCYHRDPICMIHVAADGVHSEKFLSVRTRLPERPACSIVGSGEVKA